MSALPRTRGSPALRLIGDVEPIDVEARERARVIRDNVTADAVIRNFLQKVRVADPLQYIHFQAHAQRKWLPVWAYIKQARLKTDSIIADLRGQIATHPSSRDSVVQRLLGRVSAYKDTPGKPALIKSAILSGTIASPNNEADDMVFAIAIQGLPNSFRGADALKPLLLRSLDRAQGADSRSSNRRSSIYRAASRIDEILYKPVADPVPTLRKKS